MVSNRTLAKIAVVGGFVALGSASLFKWKIERGIKQSAYFQLAEKRLLGSEEVISLLGKPIYIGTLDLGDTKKNFCDGLQARFHVPVKGSKSAGLMVFEASRDPPKQSKWKVEYVDLYNKEGTSKLISLSGLDTTDLVNSV